MKATLIKNHYGFEYFLAAENGRAIATSNDGKLSKQNCDEIFGVVDVEKLVKEKYPNVDNEDYEYDSEWQMLADEYKQKGFIQGVKEILELNKDKLFTSKDIEIAMRMVFDWSEGDNHSECTSLNELLDKFQSLQQSTEIEVEIEMETCSMNPLDLDCDEIIERIKLDSDDCLILKKI
jgi:hypothetical protein